MRETGWRRAACPLPAAWHVPRRQARQMHATEFKSLAAVDGHNTHGIDVCRLGSHRAENAIIVEGFDAANALDRRLRLGSPLATCSLQTLSS